MATALDEDQACDEQLLRRHLHELDVELRQRSALRDRLADALASARDPDDHAAVPASMEVTRTMVLQQDYVHGYHAQEGHRLDDQAQTLADLLHADTRFLTGSHVLELGCGVGAQSVELLARSPGIELTCVDRSLESLRTAGGRLQRHGTVPVRLLQADLYDLPQADGPLQAAS